MHVWMSFDLLWLWVMHLFVMYTSHVVHSSVIVSAIHSITYTSPTLTHSTHSFPTVVLSVHQSQRLPMSYSSMALFCPLWLCIHSSTYSLSPCSWIEYMCPIYIYRYGWIVGPREEWIIFIDFHIFIRPATYNACCSVSLLYTQLHAAMPTGTTRTKGQQVVGYALGVGITPIAHTAYSVLCIVQHCYPHIPIPCGWYHRMADRHPMRQVEYSH